MRQDPASATFKTYKLKISMLENFKPEEFLKVTKNFNTVLDMTVTTTATKKNNYLRIMLRGDALREFGDFASQVTGATNTNLNFIKAGLLGISPQSMHLLSRIVQ